MNPRSKTIRRWIEFALRLLIPGAAVVASAGAAAEALSKADYKAAIDAVVPVAIAKTGDNKAAKEHTRR